VIINFFNNICFKSFLMSNLLKISGLRVSVEGQEILKGIDLEINEGEIHAIMGPNGSGKSSLVMALMGHPKYEVTAGKVVFRGQDLLNMAPNERSNCGLFLSFQHPREVEGVTLTTFLHTMYKTRAAILDPDSKVMSIFKFKRFLQEKVEKLKVNPAFLERSLNQGFSGGEKKKMEMLQMSLLHPALGMLDEVDSGLDVDALRVVCEHVNSLKNELNMSVLMVTHYQRILRYIEPDHIHVMKDGLIVRSGDKHFAHELEEKGYEHL
jgi:Fe-S cluster assembly ATP-binding protein